MSLPFRGQARLGDGRGTQTGRQLLLMRYLAQSSEWLRVTELVSELYGSAYRTAYRDIELLLALGVPLEKREALLDSGQPVTEYRLRRSKLMGWLAP